MEGETTLVAAARAGERAAFENLVAPFRQQLKGHCYRMSGSAHEAEDLLQDSLLKAWRAIGAFEGRSSVRTWLFKVATSVCLDALDTQKRRRLPPELGPAADPTQPMAPPSDIPWLEPCPDEWVAASSQSPESRYTARQSVELAFLSALQVLPPKQRAVLILQDVVGYSAAECAELLDTSVASVNSALQRARAALPAASPAPENRSPTDPVTRDLLSRYVRAWEQANVNDLIQLLREDAVLTMPPFSAWFRGPADIGASLRGMVLPPEAAGQFRLVEIAANGQPAFAMYQRDPASGLFQPAAIHVLHLADGGIARLTAFLDPTLLAIFGVSAPAQ